MKVGAKRCCLLWKIFSKAWGSPGLTLPTSIFIKQEDARTPFIGSGKPVNPGPTPYVHRGHCRDIIDAYCLLLTLPFVFHGQATFEALRGSTRSCKVQSSCRSFLLYVCACLSQQICLCPEGASPLFESAAAFTCDWHADSQRNCCWFDRVWLSALFWAEIVEGNAAPVVLESRGLIIAMTTTAISQLPHGVEVLEVCFSLATRYSKDKQIHAIHAVILP